MTDDPMKSVLEAELDSAGRLLESLEQQRQALLARDLDLVDELTASIEQQFEHFGLLIETRVTALRADGAHHVRHGALLRRLRSTETRLLRLAQLNHELIADRLAHVGAMLSVVGMSIEPGYASHAPGASMSRSA